MKDFILIILLVMLSFIEIHAQDKCLYSIANEHFSKDAQDSYIQISKQPDIISINKININISTLLEIPESIEILLENERILLYLKMVKILQNDNYRYISYSNDETFIFISMLDETIIADILSPLGTYNIVTCSDKEYALVKVDDSFTEMEPEELKYNNVSDDTPDIHTDAYNTTEVLSSVRDAIPYIRILVLYTDEAAQLISNPISPAQIKVKIYHDINKANESFKNSDIHTAFELVYIGRTSADETGLSFSQILDKFIATSDQYIDEVHTLRNQYSADICVLLVEDPNYCGMSYVNVTASQAFSVVRASVGCSDKFSFAHEIGHLVGCNHDVTEHPGNTPYQYGHGYVHYVPGNSSSSWRTMMAYSDACNNNYYNCIRIPNWSNPNISINGIATGDATYANNARVWNERAQTVSNFKTIPSNKTLTSSDNNMALYNNIRVSQSITTQNGYQVQNGQSVELIGGTQIRLLPNTHIMNGSNFHACVSSVADTTAYPHFIKNKGAVVTNVLHTTNFSVTPNPVNDMLSITTTEELAGISIYNLSSQCMMQTAETKINVSRLPAGMYILRATTTDGEQLQSKFIKQ